MWNTLSFVERCFGIVLSVLDFREKDQIVTVFSPGGLIKFFIRGKRSPLMVCLTEGEFVYAEGRGELNRFRDGTIINQNLRLRERFESLEAAGRVVRGVLQSQLLGKAAPDLYQLMRFILRMLPDVEHPEDLATIFLIKALKHEGLFQQSHQCSLCDGATASLRYGGERFCTQHAPLEALKLTDLEERRLVEVAEGRVLKELLTQPLGLQRHVDTLFSQAFGSRQPAHR